MIDWYSQENLERAWKYARIEIRDDFVFDVINYEDIKLNLKRVLSSLHTQLKYKQYYPAPLLRIGIPKNDYSVRPGTTIPIVDLIVLYAIAQQLAPLLDPFLSDSAYAYRLNPKAEKSRQPLFKDKISPHAGEGKGTHDEAEREEEEEETSVDVEFPSGWFVNWKAFHDASRLASEEYEYAAVTDITAYFENISLDLLREILKGKLNSDDHCKLVDRLFRMLEYWDWTPSGNLPRGIGLPQGNDVSSFLSNLYLMALDDEMLKVVSGDTSKYGRYVDDVKLFTSDRDEARRALVRLEEVLRTLNLNVQSAKTEIKPATEIFDDEIELWLDKMSNDNPDKIDHAIEFFENVFDKNDLKRWRRPYSRSLTVLRDAGDDRALDVALELFLNDPSHRLLNKHFLYLRKFVTSHSYSQAIADRLAQDIYTFPYHRGVLFRLAAYSRDVVDDLKQLALRDSTDSESHWFCRMAALFSLGTFPLNGADLASIAGIVDTEANPQVVRAAFVVLCQNSGDELRWVLDRVSLFNAPHQDYLRRYFFQLYRNTNIGKRLLAKIRSASVRAPTFIHNLHQLDLMKVSSDKEQRAMFREILEKKIKDCADEEWPRLTARLKQIYDSFILIP